jgi:hypothetical protein
MMRSGRSRMRLHRQRVSAAGTLRNWWPRP